MLPTPIYLQILPSSDTGGAANLQRLFLKDPKADLYIVMKQLIFPVHRKYLHSSNTIKQHAKNQKFFHVDQNYGFDVKLFQKVLSLFYDMSLQIQYFKELEKVLDILDFLDDQPLIVLIQKQIVSQINEYDTFYILNLAYQFGLREVYNICFQNLKNEDYEQMLYNKFDFMHCDFRLFQIVLRIHQVLQERQQIYGVSPELIEEIVELYCNTHYYNEDTKNRLLKKYGVRQEEQGIRVSNKIRQIENCKMSNKIRQSHRSKVSNRIRESHYIRDSNKSKNIRESSNKNNSSSIQQSHNIRQNNQIRKSHNIQGSNNIRQSNKEKSIKISQGNHTSIRQSNKSKELELNKYARKQISQSNFYEGKDEDDELCFEEEEQFYRINLNHSQQQQAKQQMEEQLEYVEEVDEGKLNLPQLKEFKSPTKNRRYSEQINAFTHQFGVTPSFRKIQKSYNNRQYLELKENIDEKVTKKIESAGSSFQPPNIQDDPEAMVGKISTLLGEYESAYQLHDSNLQTLKKKSQVMKSMIFNEEGETGARKSRNQLFGNAHFQLNLQQGNGGLFGNIAKSVLETQHLENNKSAQSK